MMGDKKNVTVDSILWRRLDQPGHESALAILQAGSYHLNGTAVFSYDQGPCRLDYRIVCDSQWRTSSARVDGWVGNRLIEIEIAVNDSQRWQLNRQEAVEVDGCVDLDLNFSPSTNLLPIRRLNLEIGQEEEVRAAWLRFPSFKLEPLVQIYRRLNETTYRYESAGGSFIRELTVNSSGFVTKYPDFWEMEQSVSS